MNIAIDTQEIPAKAHISRATYLYALFAGLLLPFGFAPFHFPGLAILSLAMLFLLLKPMPLKKAFRLGFIYGIGFFGFGVSWIYVSIHQYGHLPGPIAAAITLLFITYLASFIALFTTLFVKLEKHSRTPLWNAILFSALWCLIEYLRAISLGGFPWLSIGFGQIDSPLQHLLPIIGVPGTSFLTCFIGCLLAFSIQPHAKKYWLIAFLTCLLAPLTLQSIQWTTPEKETLSVGIIQANLSMRDKWDETLFWKILNHYTENIERLLGKKQLIVLPESAIPVPSPYVSDVLESLDIQAKQQGSAILLGIPVPTRRNPEFFYNALIGLGDAEGKYFKQHLVAFGEFVPSFLSFLNQWLNLPPNLSPGPKRQSLITIQHQPIATLICYELAFPELLRKQLPQAKWIVSISDDGWFGHSLALFQHIQMAQVLSKQTGRYQIVANNDGLSAVIKDNGEIKTMLPAFSQGVLETDIMPKKGSTPWSTYGDKPCYIIFCLLICMQRVSKMKKTQRFNIAYNRAT